MPLQHVLNGYYAEMRDLRVALPIGRRHVRTYFGYASMLRVLACLLSPGSIFELFAKQPKQRTVAR